MKRLVSAILALTLLFALCVIPAAAKTTSSAKADRVFVYAKNSSGKNVLIKVVTLDELKAISHGQPNGKNYYISSTDNYPTTQYCESIGITIPELVNYVKGVTTVRNASALGFTGNDTIRLMATDSYGNYNRSWTYNELYGTTRYYFEGLFKSWSINWEIAGEDNSKFGLTLDEYNAKYKDSDPYYAAKRTVFSGGVVTVPILATTSFSGRTTTDSLVASTEVGIADYIAKNGGVVAGSLKDVLTDETALRLALPMTEADLMAAHRTSFDNFKWIYNILLEQATAPNIVSLGTVAEPVVSASASGNTLTFTLSCATAGASIYYGDDGAPQTLYTKPVTVDITGRDLAANPVTFYATAVKEGYDDAGIITTKYPELSPTFKTMYSGMANQSLIFEANDSVSASVWTAWANKLTSITIKTPSASGYVRIDAAKYKVNNTAKTITFDKSLFPDTGSYSFIFHATGFADKSASVTIKKPAPTITPAPNLGLGSDIVFTFNDTEFQSGLTLYVTPPGGTSTMISTSYLDRTQSGKVTLKASYFATTGCAIKTTGAYTFSFVNNKYSPDTVTVKNVQILGAALGTFADVRQGAWFYDAVKYVTDKGLMTGTATTAFAPTTPMSRAMLATVLYRTAGEPRVTGTNPFSDVKSGQWYTNAVIWANSKGIVTGYGNGKFGTNDDVTREEIAVMLYRYAGSLAASGNLSAFSDANKVSSWATSAMKWAAANHIINGSDGKLNPKSAATRAEVAQMLKNYGA
ncbi:MAG: S-layer homology domain-containing protein [Oscillospiraceae bacterium]|jgi:hypothetical protein|nr:S-layer homology domain-containing protein [Oscillospiraceae bacterium]